MAETKQLETRINILPSNVPTNFLRALVFLLFSILKAFHVDHDERCGKTTKDFVNGPTPASFPFIFGLFKHQYNFATNNFQNYPHILWSWVTNSRLTSVTRKKSPNVCKSCPKMISLEEKLMILTTLQKLPKNVGDLGKLIIAKGFEKLPKVQ